MEIDTAKQFQEKLDEVLMNTEEFANASKQLQEVHKDMDAYIAAATNLNKEMAETSKAYAEILKGTSQLFDGEFEEKTRKMITELQRLVDECHNQANNLKKAMESMEYTDIKTELNKLSSQMGEIKRSQEENNARIDRLMSIFGSDNQDDTEKM